MKQLFVPKNFSKTSEYVIQIADQILTEYRGLGYRLSLRQLYYQMIARDVLPDSWRDKHTNSKNSIQSYKKVGDIVSDARLAGRLDCNRHFVKVITAELKRREQLAEKDKTS
jgi:hypothetical protein